MKGGRAKEGLMGEFRLEIGWKKCHHTCASLFVQKVSYVVWRMFKNDWTAQSPPSAHAHSFSTHT